MFKKYLAFLRNPKILLFIIVVIASILRLYKITSVPVALFGDELDVGYHAYSILKTGKDYTGNPWPLHFHSLAEWRTPLYLYSAVPTVALFGISPLGVRLPAAFFGVVGVLGMYFLLTEILNYASVDSKNGKTRVALDRITVVPLIASFFLAISPWHLQYSRAGFEVTELIAFLLFGLFFFFRALRLNGRGLWISVLLLCFTPWIYSTAKLFTPLLLICLFIMWRKEIFSFPGRRLARSVIVGLVIGLPIAYSTIWGGGAERASYISIFTDPTVVPEIGTARLNDLMVRGQAVLGSTPSLVDRSFHNKFVVFKDVIVRNYLQSFSSGYLFNQGDPNYRHSIHNMGEMYTVELIALIAGLYFFFQGKIHFKVKILVFFWLIAGALPSALTRDGGEHATRLILILPPLIILTAIGAAGLFKNFGKYKYLFSGVYLLILFSGFLFYLHNYYVHYPWESERWWHAGFKEAVAAVKEEDAKYDKVIISMAGEPAWIFFSALYPYPPDRWQKDFPIGNDVELNGFGKISHIDKYYFGNFAVAGGSLYDLGKYIDNKTLYLAVAREMPPNLIMDPERTPGDLKLLKAIPYPSGEPAFYLFTKN